MDLIQQYFRFLTDDILAVFTHHVKTCAHNHKIDLNEHGQANSDFCIYCKAWQTIKYKAQTTKQIHGTTHITAMQGTVYDYDVANYILSVMYYAFIRS
jgi:hypothetical protein